MHQEVRHRTTDSDRSQRAGGATAGFEQAPGHMFVAQGSLERFAVDDVIIPCDERLRVTHGFANLFGMDVQERVFVPSKAVAPRDFASRDRPPLSYGRAHERGPRLWLVNSATPSGGGPLTDEHLDWLITGLRTALARIAGKAKMPMNHRARPVIAIPLLGIGTGGFNHIRGRVLAEYLQAVAQFVATPAAPDVVIVARERSDYAALQAHRPKPEDVDPEIARLADLASIGELVVFLGAGVSSAAGLPDWPTLLRDLALRAGIPDPEEILRLPPGDSAELIARTMHSTGQPIAPGQATRLQLAIAELFGGQRHSLAHALLASLRLPEAITTNYDTMYEDACESTMPEGVRVLPHERLTHQQPWLLKLHGDIRHPGSIVLTRGDYMRLDVAGIPLAAVVQASMVTHHVLFLGYSLSDDNFIRLARQVTDLFGAAGALRQHVGTVLTLGPMPYKEQLWEDTLTFHDVTRHTQSAFAATGSGHIRMGSKRADRERIARTARDLEIVLDEIAQLATRDVSYAMDPRYDSVIPARDRLLIDKLGEVAKILSSHDEGGAIRDAVAGLLTDLGWRGSARAKENSRPAT